MSLSPRLPWGTRAEPINSSGLEVGQSLLTTSRNQLWWRALAPRADHSPTANNPRAADDGSGTCVMVNPGKTSTPGGGDWLPVMASTSTDLPALIRPACQAGWACAQSANKPLLLSHARI